MKNRRFLALALSAVLVIGSSVTVFATEEGETEGTGETGSLSEITGEGTAFEHVDKKVLTVTLPTEDAVAGVFNYYVDPEGLVDAAKSLTDGTAVTGNEDGVYFKNAATTDDGSATYSSTSDAVTFEGKNSVDIDVSVKAAVAKGGDNDIALVADGTALAAAADPALLMTLKVGEASAAITSDGATATATIAGVPNNFEVKAVDGKFVYAAKSDAAGWKSTTIQLSGKTNSKEVPADTKMSAPTIKLTWDIKEHVTTPAITLSSTYSRANDKNEFTLSNIGNLTVTGIKGYLADGETETSTAFSDSSWEVNEEKTTLTINGTTAPFGAGAVGQTRGIGLVLSDGTIIKVTFTVQA